MIGDYTIWHHESLPSSNDEARRLAAEGAPSGTVVHTDEQTAGRGRRARQWFSPPGNLYLSIQLRTGLPPARSLELGFLTAIAVAETVEALLPKGRQIRLKWPNDVLVGDAKISGILVEQADDAVIVGIGLNVLHAPNLDAYKTATIVASGGIATVDGARDILLERFKRLVLLWAVEGFAPIRDRWSARSYPVGTKLVVNSPAGPVTGTFVRLDPDGALVLGTDAGDKRIVAGDVALSG